MEAFEPGAFTNYWFAPADLTSSITALRTSGWVVARAPEAFR